MEQIDEFDTVLLKDGRKAVIIEVLGNQEHFIADVGSSPKDWETIDVSIDEIEKVLRKSK